MRNKLVWLFLAAVCMIIIYILAAPYIYHIFFPKYADSILYSQIFSISLFWIVSIPTDAYLLAKKKIKEQYTANIVICVMQTVFLFIGIIFWGLMGLVVAKVAAYLISIGISIALYDKASKQND